MTLNRELIELALPGYVIGDELGRGAHGIVVAGTHRTLHRDVAIKQLPRAVGLDPVVRQRFLAEARTLASFDHPNIVPVYDFVEHDGVCLLVMERLTGGTLKTRMQAGELDTKQACAVVMAACAGLSYAHGRGVLHRDIKPDNLMFTSSGTLKVTDFGIAKLVDGQSGNTQPGSVLGTPSYMAPEQAAGTALVPASDVYALGTVLYEAVSGGLPYPVGDDPVALLYRHVHEDPPLLIGTPSPIAAVIDRSLARDLTYRYSSASEFASNLSEAAAAVWGSDWEADSRSSFASNTPFNTAVRTQPAFIDWRILAGVLVVGLIMVAAVFALRSPSSNNAENETGFSLDRAAGPVGTRVTVRSERECPGSPEFVYVTATDPRAVTATTNGEIFGRQFSTSEDGTWTAQFAIPGTASLGTIAINVSCFVKQPGDTIAGPYFTYPAAVDFVVTK